MLAYCLQTPSKSGNTHWYLVLTAQSVGTRGFEPGDPGPNPRCGVWKKDWVNVQEWLDIKIVAILAQGTNR